MRLVILSVLIGLCCLQLATGSPNPFFNIFSPIVNVAKAVTGAVATTTATVAKAAVNTTAAVTKAIVNTTTAAVNTVATTGAKTIGTIANATSSIPIIGTVAQGVATVANVAEKAINTTTGTIAATTTNLANTAATTANNLANTALATTDNIITALAQPFDINTATNLLPSINGIVDSILNAIPTGAVLPANTGNFLTTANTFVGNLLNSFNVPNLNNITYLLDFLQINDLPGLLTNISTNGANIINGLPGALSTFLTNGTLPDLAPFLGNATELLFDAATIAAIVATLKLRLKLFAALTALQIGGNILNATAQAVG